MSKVWDNSKLKKLKTLIGKGLSTSEIGKKIGMSKNAVVGKLNRLGWNIKANDEDDKKSSKKKKDAKKTDTKKAPAKKTAVKTKVKAKKTPVKKPVVKKAEPKKKVGRPAKTVKIVAKKEKTKKAVAVKQAKTTVNKKTKSEVKEKPVIKTASKKTKKDLALHELLIQHALQMANLKPNQCRWPIGDPDSDNFHFCGETVFSGKPYCYEHCRQAYQFTPPKKK